MKFWVLPVAMISILFIACKTKQTSDSTVTVKDSSIVQTNNNTDSNFFPVTNYIKGQIASIKNGNINPILVVKQGSKTDSSWIQPGDAEKILSEFLSPEIDTVNMKSLYAQKSFLDQTVNAFTFTYDPIATLPDSLELQHWDVYVDPEKYNVRRIYLVKNKEKGKRQIQLTWLNNSSAKIISIVHKPDGSPLVEKETILTWNFN